MTDRLDALRALAERVEAGKCPLNDSPKWLDINGDLAWSAFHGSLDALSSLCESVLKYAHQVTLDWGPSGCGATVAWWPDGLSGERQFVGKGHGECTARAGLQAVLQVLIAEASE